MRVLLTGATGFVGKSLVESFSPDDEIVCLGRSGEGSKFVQTDISISESVVAASKTVKGEFDALVHLAAYVPKIVSEDKLDQANNINEVGLVNLLDAFGARVKKVILGSTVEVYDQSRILNLINEDTPLNPGSFYATTKLASEYIARTYGKINSVPVLVLRFSVMYGPNDPISRALPNFIKAALNNEDIVVRGGDSLRDYIHVSDVVQSIHDALGVDKSGVINIGTGKSISIKDAARAVVISAGSKSNVIVEPGGKGVDIVIDPTSASKLIGFNAKAMFPDQLGDMVNSYR